MKTHKRFWIFLPLECFLAGALVGSSALPSGASPKQVFSPVGGRAVLPCSWKDSPLELAPSSCHVQWLTPPHLVFEQHGEDKWLTESLEGRVELPPERLGAGDCSLTIEDVHFEDMGRYEGFMVVDSTRFFIQSVKLSVTDHKTEVSLPPGADLALDLYTHRSSSLVFQAKNASEWKQLWQRGEEDGERLQKNPHRQELTLKQLQLSDEGTYKVLDEYKLSISTVQLYVRENSSPMGRQAMENITDAAAAPTCGSTLLVCSLLLSVVQILLLR